MALKKSYQSGFGTQHSESYHKVDRINFADVGSPASNQFIVNIGVYASEAARTAGSQSMSIISYSLPYTASINESFVSQSYTYIKNLPEYSGSLSIDV